MKDDRSVDLDHLVKEAREAANEAERKLCEVIFITIITMTSIL